MLWLTSIEYSIKGVSGIKETNTRQDIYGAV